MIPAWKFCCFKLQTVQLKLPSNCTLKPSNLDGEALGPTEHSQESLAVLQSYTNPQAPAIHWLPRWMKYPPRQLKPHGTRPPQKKSIKNPFDKRNSVQKISWWFSLEEKNDKKSGAWGPLRSTGLQHPHAHGAPGVGIAQMQSHHRRVWSPCRRKQRPGISIGWACINMSTCLTNLANRNSMSRSTNEDPFTSSPVK